GKRVTLHGWFVSGRVVSSKVAFFTLQDTDGSRIQLLYRSKTAPEELTIKGLKTIRDETPVAVTGVLQPKQMSKQEIGRGEQSHEVVLEKVEILNTPTHIPVKEFNDDFALSHRYLYWRVPENLKALRLRSRVASLCRGVLEKNNFLEVETPLLFKSTPEGAREFLVPTRSNGLAYSLPQSPQQYKQILMASGVGRYYQIARCFRDEDLRADRQPEFTQLDLEMSYVKQEDVIRVIEYILRTLWKEVLDVDIGKVPRLTYGEAMGKFGSDKPDLRYELEVKNVTEFMPSELLDSEAPVVEAVLIKDGVKLPEVARGGLLQHEQFPALDSTSRRSITEFLGACEEDLVILTRRASRLTGGSTAAGRARTAAIEAMTTAGLWEPSKKFSFCWVVDFPLFTPSTDNAAEPGQGGTLGLSSTHHPFTAPVVMDRTKLAEMVKQDPLSIKGQHYDIVCNGVELGGGSIRIHDAVLQRTMLTDYLGIPSERLVQFSHLIAALSAGCPPHGGIALGFDRLVAMLHGTTSIRDVIAFPKNSAGRDMLVGSPSPLDNDRLKDYHLTL
ncbi:hypothetical protein SAICODRAFT_42218, partial [Saitoella complicata NRRL Y-17804]